MGYQNTPAFMTASNAWHAGESVWPGNPRLVVRRANIYPPTNDLEMPGANLGDLGWAESIGPLIQTLASLGKTAYDVRRSQLDAQHERDRQNAADQAAAQAAAEAKAAAQAATKAAAVQTQAINAGGGSTDLAIGAVGLGVIGLGLYLFLRKK